MGPLAKGGKGPPWMLGVVVLVVLVDDQHVLVWNAKVLNQVIAVLAKMMYQYHWIVLTSLIVASFAITIDEAMMVLIEAM